MDEATKKDFKTRFTTLTIMLNIIILCFAIGIFVLLRFAPEWTPGLVIGLLLLAAGAVVSISFRKRYIQMKVWLSEQP